MVLSAPPRGLLPSLPCLHLPLIPSPSLLLLSSRPFPNTSLLASRSSKPCPGLGRPCCQSLRVAASDEETSTAVVAEGAVPNRVEGPSFLMNLSPAEEDTPDGGEQITQPAHDPLSKLSLKMDSQDAYSMVFFGAGTLVALWISAAVISSIDSLPVFPKVMEVIGLGFTVWFSSQYLIFKENRDELISKLDDLKQKILGTSDN